jgi:hypothetical protein
MVCHKLAPTTKLLARITSNKIGWTYLLATYPTILPPKEIIIELHRERSSVVPRGAFESLLQAQPYAVSMVLPLSPLGPGLKYLFRLSGFHARSKNIGIGA